MDKQSLLRTLIIYNLANLAVLAILLYSPLSILPILLIMCGSTGMIIHLTNRLISNQYLRIKDVAEKVSHGDHTLRIPTLDIEEFNLMGQSLNQMLGKLDSTIGHLAVHREELRLIVSTIDDALWSQNPEGRIEWANDAFYKLFGWQDNSHSAMYWEIIREPMLTNLIKDFSGTKLVREITIKDGYYLLIGSHNVQAQRYVFTLQNIDAIRQAEQMKKDFIVNLAHELRTPLTAIKGFSEAMEETAKPANVRYLKIIQNHTNRLISLIEDLQQLIRLEQSAAIRVQEINVETFFENIRMILNPMLEGKAVRLRIDLDKSIKRFWVDPFKFEQIFINLVQNSLRYTEVGEILIKTLVIDTEMQIEVSDTGSGIEAKHLPRIFERFYVADPSRNKANSGTGLGLAIVKHIVQLHQGSIEVHSEPQKGCCFIIRLPLNGSSFLEKQTSDV